MARFAAQSVYDGGLDRIAEATSQILLDGQPADRAAALAGALITATIDSGDFTKAAGDVSGRKVTIGAQNGLDVDATGNANHVALIDGTELIYVTTMTQQAVTAGNTADVGAWAVEFRAPAAP